MLRRPGTGWKAEASEFQTEQELCNATNPILRFKKVKSSESCAMQQLNRFASKALFLKKNI
jgi:hypothetical protein